MKKGALVTLAPALGLVFAQAVPANAVVGAGAAGPVIATSGSITTATCMATATILVTEATVDTSPVQTRGKVVGTGAGPCGMSAYVRVIDIHLYVNGDMLYTENCGGAPSCSTYEVPFSAPGATAVLKVVSHVYFEATSGNWTIAGLSCVINSRTDAMCGPSATTVV